MEGTTTMLELVNPERDLRIPLPHYSGWRANSAEFGDGDGGVTLPMDLMTLPSAFEDDPYGWSLDYWWWQEGEARPSYPLFSGCVTNCVDQMAAGAQWERALDLEVFKHHLLRRRLGVALDFLPFVDTTGIEYALIMGDKILNSVLSAPAFPTGRMNAYPGSRTDFRWWTMLRSAPPAPGRSPEILSAIQSGGNAWDAVIETCRRYDLWLDCVETGVAEWTYRVYEGYIRTTFGDQLTLSDTNGVLDPLAFRRGRDWRPLANVFVGMGKGQTSNTDAQYGSWYEDSASRAIFGTFEDGQQMPNGMTSAAESTAAAKALVTPRLGPKDTVECVLTTMPYGRMFGVDWGQRDVVKVHHSRLLRVPVELPVKGWAVSQAAEGATVGLQLTLGDTPYNWEAHLRSMVGDLSGRTAGGIPVSKSR